MFGREEISIIPLRGKNNLFRVYEKQLPNRIGVNERFSIKIPKLLILSEF